MKVSIQQLEPSLAQELEIPYKTALQKLLGRSVPDGLQLRVAIRQANGRKKRSDAAADTFAFDSEPVTIWFEPSPTRGAEAHAGTRQPMEVSPPATNAQSVAQVASSADVQVHPAELELLKALDRAESTPGWTFVALKKFRDEILPLENTPSIRSDVERQNVLRSAIDKRLILKGQVQNPKAPHFPVTTIRLNRFMPEVQEVLGRPKMRLEFHPVPIKGEPLSATILRERR
jgi:hypothetical protein